MAKFIVVDPKGNVITPLCNDLETALDKAIHRLKEESFENKYRFSFVEAVNDFKNTIRNNKSDKYRAYKVEPFYSDVGIDEVSEAVGNYYSSKCIGYRYAIFEYHHPMFSDAIEERFRTPLTSSLLILKKVYKTHEIECCPETLINTFLDEIMSKWRSIDEAGGNMSFIIKLYLFPI